MHIRAIRIERFRHLRDIEITAPAQKGAASGIVLAGPNGGGKSSILEVLSFAISSSFAYNYVQTRQMNDYSFEVDLGLTASEADILNEWIRQRPSVGYLPAEELHQLVNDRWYTRFFSPSDAGSADRSRHDRAHNLVQSVLRQEYGRPTGFALRADRSYPVHGFEQGRLLQNYGDHRQRAMQSAYQMPDFQYRDMLDFLIEQQYHYFHDLGRYHYSVEVGPPALPKPTNPVVPYNDLLQEILPGYSITTMDHEQAPTNLYVRLPQGHSVPFSDLSSGEKEVFFILANFIRQDLSDAIITVDEPELHLHPELSRRLIRTMLEIRPGNQIWLATHNGEVFDEIGRDRTYFVTRDSNTSFGRAVRATEAGEAEALLREMFGSSGYIGVGRALLFIEGITSSVDRKVFSRLFASDGAAIKVIPAGGVDSLNRINAAILKIIEGGLSWMSFYALRDRDYLTSEEVADYNAHPSGRLRVLGRCHIENYLLDEAIISDVLIEVFDKDVSAESVLQALRTIAQDISAETLAQMVSFRLQRLTWPQDFSSGSSFKGASIYKNGEENTGLLDALQRGFLDAANEVLKADESRLSPVAVEGLMNNCKQVIANALVGDSDEWRAIFPGKRLMGELAKHYSVDATALQNSVILRLVEAPESIPPELRQLIDAIGSNAPISSSSDET